MREHRRPEPDARETMRAGSLRPAGTVASPRPPRAVPPPPPRTDPERGRGEGWAVLILTSLVPAWLDMLAHARALAGSQGSVAVRLVRPGALVEEAREAMADQRFRVVLADLDDPAVGEAGAQALAQALAEEFGETGPLLMLLCPPGDAAPRVR